MHNFFLGLIKEHFHNIIGIGWAKTAEGAVVFVEFPDPLNDFTDAEQKSLATLRKMLQRPLNNTIEASPEAVKKKLMRFHHHPLAFACEILDVERSYQCPTDSCWIPVIPAEWKLAEGSANTAILVVSHSGGILAFRN